MNLLDNYDEIILPEEYLTLQKDDLHDTFWTDNLDNGLYLIELELIIDFDSIKDDLYNCRFMCNYHFVFGHNDRFTLLTILYLANKTKIIKSKIINSKLKLNIYPGMINNFYATYLDYASINLIYNNECYIESKRGKFIDCNNETEIKYFDNLEVINIRSRNWLCRYCMCMFIWFNVAIDEEPIIKFDGICIDPDKIKKINVFGNNGLYVQTNLLTFDQIFSLGNYEAGYVRDKLILLRDYVRIEVVNYDETDYIIDQIYL